jgi:hypothetical protein
MVTQNEALSELNNEISEIRDILRKSGYALEKEDGDEDDQMPPQADGMAPPAPDAQMPPQEGHQEPDGDEDAQGQEPAGPEEGQEGQQDQEDPAAMLAEQAKDLSDEELGHMIEALMQEKESRSAAAQAPAEGQQPPMAPPADPAMKSMKEDFAALTKSLATMADAIGSLSKEVVTLKTAPKVASKVVTKPIASNKQNIQVLEKSAPVKQRLTKSETIAFLETEQRKGNKNVNAGLFADIIKADTQVLNQIQDSLAVQGIELPKK